mgnify:CR=1 FL=1
MSERIVFKSLDRRSGAELEEFLSFPVQLYGNTAKTRNGIAKTRQIIDAATTDHRFLVAKKDGVTIGRMAVGSNNDIRDQTGAPYGQIGLFEVVEDYQTFAAMLDYGRYLCKERCRSILFPFYISTWYQYRFISKGFDAFEFFLETDNKDYYAPFARRYGVEETFLYRSYLNTIDDFTAKNKPAHDKAVASGIMFRPFNMSDVRNELRIVYDLSTRGFQTNPFYIDITFERFLDLYRPSLKILDKDFFIFVLDETKKPLGYVFCAPDYTGLYTSIDLHSLRGKMRFLLERKRVSGLIMKSGAIHSAYQGRGLSNALSYRVGMLAKQRNYHYIILALMHAQNRSTRLSSSDKTEKEYELYTIAVTR